LQEKDLQRLITQQTRSFSRPQADTLTAKPNFVRIYHKLPENFMVSWKITEYNLSV